MSEQPLVRLTKWNRSREMYSLYDETRGNKETHALSTENCLRQVQEERQMIIKEEGSKDEDRQEGAGVKTFLTKTLLAEVWVLSCRSVGLRNV